MTPLTTELEVKIETPLSVGSYDPYRVDELWYLRPTSIKGVWRWWARTIVAGVLHDRGLLNSGNGLRLVSQIVSEKMGLGSTEKPSLFKLAVEVKKEPEHLKEDYLKNFQRYKLLSKREGAKPQFVRGGIFSIKLEPLGDVEGKEAAIWSLLVALTLSGIGKGSRRGFGCLNIISLKSDELRAKWNLANPESLRTLLERAYESVSRLVEEGRGRAEGLPQIPALSKAVINGNYVSQVCVVSRVRLEDLHNFFLRSHRTKVLMGSFSAMDTLRQKWEGWILGLPRSQKKKERESRREEKEEEMQKEEETGYIITDKDIVRRASPFILSYHEKTGGVLTVLTSRDWPKRLEWRSGNEKESISIGIDDAKILEATSDALGKFKEYVRKKGGVLECVWPRGQ